MLTKLSAAIVAAIALIGPAHACQLSSPDFSICVELERLQTEKLQMETDALKQNDREILFEKQLDDYYRKRDEAMEAVMHDPKLQAYVHAHPMAKGAPNGNLDPVPGGLY
jgi:hypothetical protein